jgi:LysM repeat protein
VALALIQVAQAGRAGQAEPVMVSQSAAAPAAPPPAAAPPQEAAPAQSGGGQVRVTSRIIEPRYVVGPGDTLGSIAAKTGTSIEALQSINNLADRNILSVGQRLVIPNQD